jgi:hypothetical protein
MGDTGAAEGSVHRTSFDPGTIGACQCGEARTGLVSGKKSDAASTFERDLNVIDWLLDTCATVSKAS